MGLAELEDVHGLRVRSVHRFGHQEIGFYRQIFPDEVSGIWNLFCGLETLCSPSVQHRSLKTFFN